MFWIAVAILICAAIAIAISVKFYIKLTTGWDQSCTCLVGKTIIVTGANSSIGFVSAMEFAKRGARVVMACRNLEKGNEARQKIVQETDNENVIVKRLDLASFNSVREFAEDVNSSEERVDVLLNNAGVGVSERITEDGFKEAVQVNYLSAFLLTTLLIDLLKKSAPSRIVNVSSITAALVLSLNPDRLTTYTNGPWLYMVSKLCLIFFTQELAKKLKDTGVSVFSLHPGIIDTKIYQSTGRFLGKISSLFINVFFKDLVEGAQTQIFLCAAKGLERESGGHFQDCRNVGNYISARSRGKREEIWKNAVALLDAKTNGEISKIFTNIELDSRTHVISNNSK